MVEKTLEDKRAIQKRKLQEKLFLACLFVWPAVCFTINFFVCNINSWVLAFQRYDTEQETFVFQWGISNFTRVFEELRLMPAMANVIKNSVILYLFGILITGPAGTLVSFMIYKKVPLNKFFVVILFLPTIISSIVWVLIYKYFLEYGYPILTGYDKALSLITDPSTSYTMLLIFTFWVGLGGGMIISTGTMARVEYEQIEAGMLDGCNLWQEFIHIVFPVLYPVWSIGIFTGLPAIFTGYPNTYSFFGSDAPTETWTFGYYFFKMVIGNNQNALQNYPYAAASGILFTVIVTPIVFGAKSLLERAFRD